MGSLLVSVWLMFSIFTSGAQSGLRNFGPFEVELEKLSKCDDEGTGTVTWGTKIHRTPDGKHVYNDPVYYGHPIDEDFKVKVELQSFSNGGYRPRYMQHYFKGCEEIWKYFHAIYEKFEFNGVPIKNCPLPAGNYTLKDFDLSQIIISNIHTMIYNKYRVVLIFEYKGKKVGCVIVYLEVVPKE